MNCEQYQELISAFLDNDLDESAFINVQSHLAVCAHCAKMCEDCAMILDFYAEDLLQDSLPPNSKALWCRINNIIENQVKAELAQPETAPNKTKQGWLSQVWNNSWRFSLSQVLTSILGIALISSLLTIIGFKNYSASADNVAVNASSSVFEKVLSKIGIAETTQEKRERYIKQQQATIDYWKKRVEVRRANWDNHLRDAFDRNLNEINQVVVEYDKILQENPQDEISNDMLDSAMTEKVELLREFSEL
ncbi:MAG: zf-HC2 domain-containing protein [Acidobacteria bacterium]|nr:zf-HC2 domain-containing protein [Acidobacteriota bacterium]